MWDYLCRFIMLVLGWKPLNESIKQALKNINKSVLIYPHTSYWDIITVLVYKTAYSLDNVYVPVHSGAYHKYPALMRRLNAFPATARENKNGGFVAHTIQYFTDKTQYHILLSPKGTLTANPWRSGYYYIAQGLNVPVYVVGFDYSTHEMCMILQSHHKKDLNALQMELQNDMGRIVPLHPQHSEIPLLHKRYTSVVDPCVVSTVLFPLPGLCMLYYIHFPMWMLMTVGYILSWIYHYSYETHCTRLEPFVVVTGFLCLKYTWITNNYMVYDWVYNFILLFSLYCWWMGSGRHNCKVRSREYTLWHTLFHLFVSVWCMSQTYHIFVKL